MALRPAGIELVAKNYNTYIKKQKEIRNAHQKAFNTKPLSLYNTMSKNVVKSMDNMAKSSRTLDNSIIGLQRTLSNTRTVAGSVGNTFSGVSDGLGNLVNKFRESRKGGASFKKSMMNAVGGSKVFLKGVNILLKKVPLLGTALAALQMKQYIDQATTIAVRNETLGVTFDVVAARAGFTAQQADFARESLKNTGITTAGATKQLQKMAQAGLDWANAAKLARVAQDAAVIAGANSTVAFESMTWAIQTGSAEILDNFGIMVRFSKVYEEYAKEVGKSAGALTEQEKLQARMNAVLKEGEKISGTYTAALGTAGKMQGSMARVTEELAANVGEVFLPFKTLSVELKMNFLKGLLEASKGLKQFAAVAKTIVSIMKSASASISNFGRIIFTNNKIVGGVAEEGMNIFERFGRSLQIWAKVFVESFAIAGAAIVAFRVQLQDNITHAAIALIKFFKGDFAGAKAAFEDLKNNAGIIFKETFKDELGRRLTEAKELFPDLYTAWEKLGEVAEVNMDKITKSIDDSIAALETQKKALQVQQSAIAKAASIYENFKNQVNQAFDNLTKNIAKLEDSVRQSIQKAASKRDSELAKLQDQSNKQREKLIDTHNKNKLKREKRVQKDLEKERRKFELSQLQSLRRFQLQDTRLQATGDVLALKTLREDFDLQRQEEKENFEAGKDNKKKSVKEQNDLEGKQLTKRLDELKNDIEKRRSEINASFRKEADSLGKSMIDRRNKLLADYDAQLAMLASSRDAQFRELGKSLQNQTLITQEGMDNIGAIMTDTFGDDGAAMNLLRGWTDTSKTQTELALGQIRQQFEQLDKDIIAMQERRTAVIERSMQGFRDSGSTTSRTTPAVTRRGFPMREGGSGIVEGPASFDVEPGVREAFSFAPLSRSLTGNINLGGRASVDVTGMSSNTNTGMEERISNTIMEELKEAISRFTRGGT